MKNKIRVRSFLIVFAISALVLALPALAFADEPSPTTDSSFALTQTATQAASTAETSAGDTVTIPEDEVPQSNKAYEYGWALFNLLATALTTIIAVVMMAFLLINRNRVDKPNNNSGLSVFAIIAAVFSVVLFAGTEPLGVPNAQMLIVDSYSVAHVSVLAVALLCAALAVKKDVKGFVSR